MGAGKAQTITIARHAGAWLSLLLAALIVQAEQLPVKTYSTADGLAHNRVSRIIPDSHGFLWFCTAEGLSRFDGSRFVTYGLEQGLSFPSLNDLLETRHGYYLVATNGNGVVRFNMTTGIQPALSDSAKSRFTTYLVSQEPATSRVNKLLQDRTGAIWAATDGGLFRAEETSGALTFRRVELGIAPQSELLAQVMSLAEDQAGNIWIGGITGLFRRSPDGRVERYAMAVTRGNIYALLADREGRIWVGHTAGLMMIEAGQAHYYTVAQGLRDNRVTALLQTSRGRIWLNTYGSAGNGLTEFDSGVFHPVTDERLSGSQISSIAEDRDGNLWVSTSASGVHKIARHGFITYRESDGLSSYISNIFEGQAGELYVVSQNYAISRFDGRRFISIKPNLPAQILNGTLLGGQSAIEDHLGEWWIATPEGLYRFPRVSRIEELSRIRPKAIYTTRDGLPENGLRRLFEDVRGDIWMAAFAPGHEVLTRWDRATGRFQRYSDADGLPSFNAPVAFRNDAAGNLWISFREGGLARYAAGRFTMMNLAQQPPGVSTTNLYFDSAGRLWLATNLVGLSRFDHPEAEHPQAFTYTRQHGLSSILFRSITEDAHGNIYVCTNQGIDRLDPATGQIQHYTTADGLASVEVIAAFRDRQGALWFGTIFGISRFMPEPEPPRQPSPVFIGGLRVAGVDYQVSELGIAAVSVPELEPNQNQIQIDYFGIGFAPGEAQRFRYQLEGADREWSRPTELHTVNYPNLPPGHYRFLVRALSLNSASSATPASVSFTILPPIWRRWWFLTLASSLMATAFVAFDRYRAARMKELGAALGESRQLTEQLTAHQTELHQANRLLALEYEVTRVLAEAATPAEAAPKILQATCESGGWNMGAIWDVEPEIGVLRCADVWHQPQVNAAEFEALTRESIFLPGAGLPGRVWQSGEALWIASLSEDLNFPRLAVAAKEGVQSAFGFPILLESEVIGVIEFFSLAPRQPDAEQIIMMSTIGSHIGQLIERKRAEESLRESEDRFRTVAQTASDAIITIDEHSTIIFVNPAAETVFGHAIAEMIGEELTMLMPEYMRHLHRAGFHRYLDTGRRHLSWQAIELPGLHKSGREIPLEVSFGEFTKNGQRFFTGIARDITERKRAEEALQRSREERLIELERVRRRIATDLHDDIGSSLTQISILSEVIRQRVGQDRSPVTEPLEQIAGASRELVDSMSDIVWAINPQKDHLRDLTQRMRRFAADSFTARNIKFQLRLPDAEADIKLGANLRREVFLIFKESVNNMVRHAHCTEAEIDLHFADDALTLKLSDNGRGFDLTRESDGHGLMSMRDRAKGIGGELELTSQPELGTTITLHIPLNHPTHPIS